MSGASHFLRSERREFFRNAARRVINPLADYLQARLDPRRDRPLRLRPPGAVSEDVFDETCRRCGACIEACPADAIFAYDDEAGGAAGTPVIDPDRAACVVCDGLKCTHVCPSGALRPVVDPYRIQMGLAEVYASLCVRTEGDHCTECVDLCPLGEAAIRFVGGAPPVVIPTGCVGCGVCQLHCPTSPKAITIKPR